MVQQISSYIFNWISDDIHADLRVVLCRMLEKQSFRSTSTVTRLPSVSDFQRLHPRANVIHAAGTLASVILLASLTKTRQYCDADENTAEGHH